MRLTGSAILALAALAGLVFVYFRYKGAVVQAVQTTLNPASSENIVNQGVTSAVSAAVGQPETFGGWLYDLTHADPTKLPAAVLTPAPDLLP